MKYTINLSDWKDVEISFSEISKETIIKIINLIWDEYKDNREKKQLDNIKDVKV